MKCCANCIGDRGLRNNTIPSMGPIIGNCGYCESQNVEVIEPALLGEVFASLVSVYQRSEEGKLLVQWFKEDWGMFDHPRMDESRSKDLLAEILNDGEIVRQIFSPSPLYQTDELAHWEELRAELMFGNRYFPNVSIDLPTLKVLLGYLKLEPYELPINWFRARLLNRDEPFTIGEMGAPPKKIASHGRANPAGIPYLYLGSTENTAIAEVRPHTGEFACVAEFTTPASLQIADLRNPRQTITPFTEQDEEKLGLMRASIPFLARLGDELTRPVLPHSAAIDYVPSQFLCEFIKKCGFDGVMYKSSVGDGVNMALFDPEKALPGAISKRTVIKVSVETD